MSNLKAIAALDAAIATLASTRDEIQKRHDETVAALVMAEATARNTRPSKPLAMLLHPKGFSFLRKR